ncbi:acetyltransferase [Pseudomonas sp. SDO528_S397]
MGEVSGLLVLGFGGHARSVADVALSSGFKTLCFIDSNARPNECLGAFPVYTHWEGILPQGWLVMPAAGDNHKRQQQYDWINKQGWPMAMLAAPTATIGFGAVLGLGTFVGHHAHVGPMASVGAGCIINTGAIVEHECTIDDFTHVSINAAVAGRSRIGSLCFIGAGSTVIDGIRVGAQVTLGAGACAHRDLLDPGVYVGVPAKKVTKEILD